MMIYLLLANLYLAIFYTFYHFLLRRETFFRLNRYYLLASLVLSFTLPLANVPLTGKYGTQLAEHVRKTVIGQMVEQAAAIHIAGEPQMVPEQVAAPQPETTGQDAATMINIGSATGPIAAHSSLTTSISASPGHWMGITFNMMHLYILGCGISFLIFLIRIWYTLAAFRDQKKQGAFSFFNLVCVSKDIEGYDDILCHENVHAREWHSLDILLVQILRIFNWFNPFIYALERSFKLQHEYHADNMASRQNQIEYAELLLATAMQVSPHSLNNQFANPSLLKSRITMLLKNKTPNRNLVKFAFVLPVVTGMVILAAACNQSSQNEAGSDPETQSESTSTQATATLSLSTDSLANDTGFVEPPPPIEPPPVKEKPRDQVRMPVMTVTPANRLDSSKAIRVEVPAPRRIIKTPLPYDEVEILPVPDSQTLMGFRNWLSQNIEVPKEAVEAKFAGTVNMTFVIDEDGKITNIEIEEDPGYGITEAITQLLERSPDWKPGIKDGQKVPTLIKLPLRFDSLK